ncbi:hypothetical protein SAMN04488107_2408 [Geodermatophilus saharensis]|uniref:DUF6875 domain-containing protein n=1 Tax=Geodermatophilus saharensis TaxID=1137994 RepID=A0A239E714_9ACTN|nr:hypothetical protein [Geodermatophilus saharensis]SNS40231.1 hypothetical protein SAMN04488107_2408 [Geodermatophilus saharensis]
MSTRTADLFLLEDLGTDGRTGGLADRDRDALRAVADWIRTFVVEPHEELGRPGPVCPFVPTSVARQRLWLAAEQVGDGGAPRVVDVVEDHKRRLLDAGTAAGDDTYDVVVVVFPDLPADRAEGVFGEVLQQIAVPSYVEDGIVFGPFYDGNRSTAIYNDGFRPFRSPVPFLFVRHGVVSDWKFFLEQEDWLTHWARRFGESGVRALAEELRRLPWNARRDRVPPAEAVAR